MHNMLRGDFIFRVVFRTQFDWVLSVPLSFTSLLLVCYQSVTGLLLVCCPLKYELQLCNQDGVLITILQDLLCSVSFHTEHRSSHRRCSIKICVPKISQNPQENTCARASFLIKLQACNFVKKETMVQVFSCEFCEILRTPCLQNTSERLFLRVQSREP